MVELLQPECLEGGRLGKESLQVYTAEQMTPENVRIAPDQLTPNVWTSALNLTYGPILKNNLL